MLTYLHSACVMVRICTSSWHCCVWGWGAFLFVLYLNDWGTWWVCDTLFSSPKWRTLLNLIQSFRLQSSYKLELWPTMSTPWPIAQHQCQSRPWLLKTSTSPACCYTRYAIQTHCCGLSSQVEFTKSNWRFRKAHLIWELILDFLLNVSVDSLPSSLLRFI